MSALLNRRAWWAAVSLSPSSGSHTDRLLYKGKQAACTESVQAAGPYRPGRGTSFRRAPMVSAYPEQASGGRKSFAGALSVAVNTYMLFSVPPQSDQQLDCALDLMRRLPPQQIEKNLSDLIDLVRTHLRCSHSSPVRLADPICRVWNSKHRKRFLSQATPHLWALSCFLQRR